jgi:dTDP-4-dehydrorhamnose reductase
MQKTKILITGANGQLGKCIIDSIKNYGDSFEYDAVDLPEMNISDSIHVKKYVEDGDYDYVINCAAYTNVGGCTNNEDAAVLANGYGPKLLAEACEKSKTRLIHISTDYVFDGSPDLKTEDSSTGPLNTYGRTKLLGETEIQNVAKRGDLEYMIIRTSWLYSEYGKNFVLTTLQNMKDNKEMNVVDDQFGTPTYAGDLAKFIVTDVIVSDSSNTVPFTSGIYHFSNLGYTTWYDFACEVLAAYKREAVKRSMFFGGVIKPCKTSDYPTNVERPKFGLLSKDKVINIYNAFIPQWATSVDKVVEKVFRFYV